MVFVTHSVRYDLLSGLPSLDAKKLWHRHASAKGVSIVFLNQLGIPV